MLKAQLLSLPEGAEAGPEAFHHSIPQPVKGDLQITMSNSTSRSSSPPSGETGAKPRAVSGSLKDRIAKFNNPSASPLVPNHPFGTAGPSSSSGAAGGRGLYGNRIPSLDPKSASHIPLGTRKVSERGGLIGNRISSSVSGRDMAAMAGGVPGPKSSGGRSASPAGSVDSSTPSNPSMPADSGSPTTSRSSSAPTSPGGGLPPSLLAATLPDTGGPGAMTPSSTRAEAGEDTSQLSAPSTPVVGATIQLPPAEYDLVPGNLKLAAAAQMQRGPSASSGPRSFARSVTSSLASQYDPSSQGNEEKQMMQDVSGISTPTGTPKAAHRDFDGSTRGEGSVAGEGSVMGEGDDGRDMDDVNQKLESLALQRSRDAEREATPGPGTIDLTNDDAIPEDVPTPSQDVSEPILDDAVLESAKPEQTHEAGQPKPSHEAETMRKQEQQDQVQEKAEQPFPPPSEQQSQGTAHPDKAQAKGLEHLEDPNQAPDLDALKSGELSEEAIEAEKDPSQTKRPVDNMVDEAMAHSMDDLGITPAPKPHADDEAKAPVNKRTAKSDIEAEGHIDADVVTEPKGVATAGGEAVPANKDDIDDRDIILGGEINVKDASPLAQTGAAREHPTQELSHEPIAKTDQKEEKEEANHLGMEASLPGHSEKESFVNEAFSGDLDSYAEPDEEAKGTEGEQGVLSEPSYVEHVGPRDVSALEKVGIGQDAHAEAKAARVTSDVSEGNSLDHPKQKTQEDQAAEHLDKRDGKTFVDQLRKEAEEIRISGALEQEDELERMGRAQEAVVEEVESAAPQTDSAPAKQIEGKEEAKMITSSGEAQPPTRSEEPITLVEETGKPMQVHIEPAPVAQPVDESAENIVPPEPSKTPVPPDFPETPHNDLDADQPVSRDEPPREEEEEPLEPSTPIDPNFIKAFPAVPDDVHPRVEIRVSPHVTPAKSPLDRRFSAGAQDTPTTRPHPSVAISTTDSQPDLPGTPTAADPGPSSKSGAGDRGSLDVDAALATPTEGKPSLAKRASTRKSPKSPLLDDEDPGDFVPGEEGWAVVTKRGAGFMILWMVVSVVMAQLIRPPEVLLPNG